MTISGHGSRPYHLPAESAPAFARTNVQTIAQRVALLRELLSDVRAIGELCCGDCARQWTAYRQAFPDVSYRGLDITPHIVATNQAQGIACTCGDVLGPAALRPFLDCDVLFFGPPLSQACDGHNLLAFHEVIPAYADFVRLLWGDLGYQGTLICVCSNTTTMGDVQRLHAQARAVRPDVNLRLFHYSYAHALDTMRSRRYASNMWSCGFRQCYPMCGKCGRWHLTSDVCNLCYTLCNIIIQRGHYSLRAEISLIRPS